MNSTSYACSISSWRFFCIWLCILIVYRLLFFWSGHINIELLIEHFIPQMLWVAFLYPLFRIFFFLNHFSCRLFRNFFFCVFWSFPSCDEVPIVSDVNPFDPKLSDALEWLAILHVTAFGISFHMNRRIAYSFPNEWLSRVLITSFISELIRGLYGLSKYFSISQSRRML